jgi:uncharacterized membrane protein
VVGILLTSFGIFWGGEGAGVEWPGSDVTRVAKRGTKGREAPMVISPTALVRLLRQILDLGRRRHG